MIDDKINELIQLFRTEFQKVNLKFKVQEALIMATFSEIIQAIEKNGEAIANCSDSLAAEGLEIKTLIERLQSGVAPTDQELSRALDLLDSQNDSLLRLKETAMQLTPTIELSPTSGGSMGEPFPTPDSSNLPESPDEIEVDSDTGDVGLPGSVDITSTTL